MFLLIDFEKAFDSVSHKFSMNILDKFNFGPSIQKWFQTFYSGAKASVLINGFLSESFKIERGCRDKATASAVFCSFCVLRFWARWFAMTEFLKGSRLRMWNIGFLNMQMTPCYF